MKPRVLVDAAAVPADRGALIRYVDGLLAALHQAGADLAVVCQRADAERYGRMAPSARILPGPPAITNRGARLVWEQTGVPVLARQVGADVIHSPSYSIPLRAGVPTVVTVHDVTWFTEPECRGPAKASYVRSATRTAVRGANRVIVPSKATRDELIRVLGADPTRIDVAYHGVDPELFHRPAEAEVRRVSDRLGLHGYPYVASLGTLERRKNVPNLVRGFARAVQDLARPPALVLAGGLIEEPDAEVDAAVRELPPGVRVVRTGYLPFSDLAGFYGGALVAAFPSLVEGFGMPVLEAMACGAAVLTTRRTSLPEVGGDAVAYTEPDAASIGTALRALLDSKDRRAALGEAGAARSREFTWAASAEAHLTTYQRALER
ncbi:glycosyl transferase [Acrocarpospora phusangensis]|uniref:Glycosyl transferase n=1 Tax=Acrocarpospora phusangensis TaxID=1070424 RepID=A0A919Q4A9_9ACTN|nr:glycosyltransferase family 1 protein [Acrocarpospora phusangensis]GIH22057.1 glycosyl transferase [Acrocarpospora phusangensis]